MSLPEIHNREIATYGLFPTLFMGLVTPDGGLEHYNGLLRVVDSNGAGHRPWWDAPRTHPQRHPQKRPLT